MELYSDLRDKKRFNCDAEIFHDNLLPGIFYPAKMYNFSKGGLYFESDQTLYIGDYINLKIEYPPQSSEDEAPNYSGVEILWRKELQNSSLKYGYGAKYIDSSTSIEKIADVPVIENQHLRTNDVKDEKDPRAHPRRAYNKSLFFISKNRNYKGLITNISRGGAFIETQNKFSVGQIITLVLAGYKNRKEVKLRGCIVRLSLRGVGLIFERRRAHKNRRSDLDRRTGLDRRSRRSRKPGIVEPVE
jgi:Tfp pilus assembly protein PilZ